MPFAVAVAVAESPAVGEIALVAVVVECPADVAVVPALAADAGALAVDSADAEFRAAADVVFSPVPASRTPIAPLPSSPPPPSLFQAFPSRAALAFAWLAGTTPAGAVVPIVGPAVVHADAEPVVVPALVAIVVPTPSGAPSPSERDQRP